MFVREKSWCEINVSRKEFLGLFCVYFLSKCKRQQILELLGRENRALTCMGFHFHTTKLTNYVV